MKNATLRAAVLLLILSAAASGQMTLIPLNGGDGSDGSFNPAANTTLDTDQQAVYQFTDFTIASGVTVTVVGSQPITIKVLGQVTINGILDASGQPGGTGGNNTVGGLGGAGGPGGGAGGDAGVSTTVGLFTGTGQPGNGPGGGQPGMDGGTAGGGTFTDPVGGGGGGGNATAGMPGGTPNAGTSPNVSGAGGPAVTPCRAGSGGGGGGGDVDSLSSSGSNDGGGGGGGGGGRVCLYSETGITVGASGSILADGGAGGTSSGNGGGGGGGSGGSIELVAPGLTIDGVLSAVGGAGGAATQTNCGCSPGGAGGDGCISICGAAGGGALMQTTPPALIDNNTCLMVTDACPLGVITTSGNATDTYLAAVSGALGAPINVGPGSIFLDINDPLFNLTFPVNTLPGIVSGLNGPIGGSVNLFLGGGIIPSGTELVVYVQGISLDSTGNLSGVSNVVVVRIKF